MKERIGEKIGEGTSNGEIGKKGGKDSGLRIYLSGRCMQVGGRTIGYRGWICSAIHFFYDR